MNIQKQLSLGVALFMTLSLTFLLIGSIKLLQSQTAQVVGEVESGLMIEKSGPRSVLKEEPVTYTISISNTTSAMTLTRLYVTDTLPIGATYITGTNAFSETLIDDRVLSWTIPSLGPGKMISFTFAVTATGTITNSDYRVVSAEGISATGQISVVTTIENGESDSLYLPIMILDPTPTATPTPIPTATPTGTPIPIPTPTPTPSCLMVEDEPNDGFSQADLRDPLCENRNVPGNFPDEQDNDDLYLIESADGRLTVTLTDIPAGTNYQLVLYRGRTRVAESNNDNNEDEEISIEVDAGKYYARVYRFEGSSSQHYLIRWENE